METCSLLQKPVTFMYFWLNYWDGNHHIERIPVAVKNIFDQAVRRKPRKHFPDDLKDQGICEWVVYKNPRMLEYVPDHFKTREMCNDAVIEDPYPLQFIPDWFVTQQQLKKWYDYWNYELIEWYKGYKKRKVQKAQIKK